MENQTKQHFSPHLRGLAHQTAKKSAPPKKDGYEGAKDEIEQGQPKEKHTSETHGTQPHPTTGVHAVHMHHMGGGKVMTHTHHEDRSRGDNGVESQEHPTEGDAHAHAQQSLPAEDNGQDLNADAEAPQDNDMDDMPTQSLGQMA